MLEIKFTVTKMQNATDGLMCGLNMEQKRISELKDD